MDDDPRLAAARYRGGRDTEGDGGPDETDEAPPPRAAGAAERAAYVETAIQQAIRRGEFEGLPGAGKPIEGLGGQHDPDWWIRRKIEREQLRGLGPPALTLRVEDRELDDQLDALAREEDVREVLADFNRRVRHARMQLLGGPPVVTALRDVEQEVSAWRARRTARTAQQPTASGDDRPGSSSRRRSGWWPRRSRGRRVDSDGPEETDRG